MRFFLIILLMASNAVFAQTWGHVITSKNGTVYLLDFESVTKKDELVTFTQLLVYPNGYDPENHEIYSIALSKQIDCENDISKTLTMIARAKDDTNWNIQTLSTEKETGWMKINRNSILGLYRNEVCGSGVSI